MSEWFQISFITEFSCTQTSCHVRILKFSTKTVWRLSLLDWRPEAADDPGYFTDVGSKLSVYMGGVSLNLTNLENSPENRTSKPTVCATHTHDRQRQWSGTCWNSENWVRFCTTQKQTLFVLQRSLLQFRTGEIKKTVKDDCLSIIPAEMRRPWARPITPVEPLSGNKD